MSKEPHTPGPWRIGLEAINTNTLEIIGGKDRVAELNAMGVGFNNGRLFSNAQLIVTAPKLLEALEQQHKAVDWLLARVIELDNDFKPTKSPVWDVISDAYDVIKEETGTKT